MIDRSKVWTGSLNELALAGRPSAKAGFYDTTLRDGEQAVGVVFEPEQKLEIARLVDDLGVGRIEAGFPRVSDDDRAAIQAISKAGLKAEIWGFSRGMMPDVEAVAELGLKYSVIETPISDLKLKALGVSREKMLERIRNTVSFATEQGIHVAYFGVDSTRADLDFFDKAYKTALDAGAKEIVIVDTIGIATPEAVTYLIKRVKAWAGDTPIHFHGHNDFGLGTACAIAAIAAGAAWVHGTIDGIGERAGNASLPEIAMALEALYGVDTGFHMDRVRAASERLRAIAGYSLEPWKAVVGQNLFVRETGAVAAQFHIPQAIEPYSSDLLDTPRGIRLGKKSGAASITIKAKDLGLEVAEDKVPALLEEVKKLAIKKRGLLTDDEFIAIAERFGKGSPPVLRQRCGRADRTSRRIDREKTLMPRFADKKVLVTGSGRGFGQVLALAFAEEGADIVVHYNSSAAGAEETAEKVRGLGHKAAIAKGNIASLDDVRSIAETAFGAFGRVDILINNVGDMALDQKSWREMDEKVVDHTLAVDVKGTMFMIHEIGSRMLDGDGGVIVNIGSQVVIAGSPRAPQYAAAKYGVIGLTKSYARAMAPKVRVNTLGAAFMETEALKTRHDWTHGRREEVLRQTPLGRIAQPEDMVGPTLFLAGDESRHMTGQFLLCNGGLAMVGA